jgi:hypothetical protein
MQNTSSATPTSHTAQTQWILIRTLWPLGEHMFGVFRLLFWLTKKPSVFYSCPWRIWYVCGLRRRLGCWSFLSYLRNGDLKMVHIKIYCFREIFCICSCLPTTFTLVFSVTSVHCNSILQHHGYRTTCYRTGSGAH